MNEATGPVQWRHLAEVLAVMPDVVVRLLRDHETRPDGMCATCTQGGTGLHVTPWPCPIRKLALLAGDIRRGRSG